jgi:hypothetical protein
MSAIAARRPSVNGEKTVKLRYGDQGDQKRVTKKAAKKG